MGKPEIGFFRGNRKNQFLIGNCRAGESDTGRSLEYRLELCAYNLKLGASISGFP